MQVSPFVWFVVAALVALLLAWRSGQRWRLGVVVVLVVTLFLVGVGLSLVLVSGR